MSKAEWQFPKAPRQTQSTLNPRGCELPGCDHDHSTLYLCQQCHPKAGLDVLYVKANGTLEITCKKCDRFVALIQVAP